jgi:hypothetical protein
MFSIFWYIYSKKSIDLYRGKHVELANTTNPYERAIEKTPGTFSLHAVSNLATGSREEKANAYLVDQTRACITI